jgi:hypothetical protein
LFNFTNVHIPVIAWGDFSLFCLDSMRSTISAKSSQCNVWANCELCSDLVLTTFLESWSGGELYIASCSYGQLEIAILHGDLEQIANWVEAPRSSSKHPWSKCLNSLMWILGIWALIHEDGPRNTQKSPRMSRLCKSDFMSFSFAGYCST